MNTTTESNLCLAQPGCRSADWPIFQRRLAESLDLLAEDQFLIIQQKQSGRFIQFACQGSFGLRVETVSNHFLKEDDHLTAEQHLAMLRLGWQPPSGSAEESTPDLDPDGSPNYFIDFPAGRSAARVAELAVATLADALAIPYPSALAYEAFDTDGNPIVLPVLGLKRGGGLREASLPEMLLQVVKQTTGIDDLDYDEDGDLCIRYGEISVFVTLLEDPAGVRICSPLVSQVEAQAGLLSRLNALNVELPDMHCVALEDNVLAVSSMPAGVLRSGEFPSCLGRFVERAEGIAIELRAKFGGNALLVEPPSGRVVH